MDAVTIAQVAIGLAGAVHHTAEFARHGASASADRAVLDGAFGLAAAAAAAALDPEQRHRLLSGAAARRPAAI